MTTDLLTALSLVFVLSFVAVMLMASRRRSLDSLKIDIQPDETEVDRLEVAGRFARRRLVATTHRVILQEVHWFLARTRTMGLPVRDLDGARLEHRMDLKALVAGLALFALVAPVGVLLVIHALAATQYQLVFGTRNHRVRFSLPGTAALGESVTRVYRAVQRQRALVHGAPSLATPLLDPPPAEAVRVVSQEAWLGVLAMMLAAGLQRALVGGIDLDSAPFLALYCAIPALVGARSDGRGGFVTGFFGFFGLVAILYPFPVLQLAAVGDQAPALAYVAAAVLAGAIGGTAGAPRGRGSAIFGAAFLTSGWFLVAALTESTSAWTIGQAGAVAFAGAVTALAVGLGREARSVDEVQDDPHS